MNKLVALLLIFLITPGLAYEAKPVDYFFKLKGPWKDDKGQPVDLKRFKDKLVVTSLFYTSCRAICPMTVQRLKKIEKQIGEKNKKLHFLLFTIDPNRDQAKALAEFRVKHKLPEEQWTLLSGDSKSSRQLAAFLGMGFSDPPANKDLHQMHSRKITLLVNGVVKKEVEGLQAELTPIIKLIKEISGQ